MVNSICPVSIGIDSNDTVWIGESSGDRIQQFDTSGNHLLTFGSGGANIGEINNPSAIDFDTDGNVYVSDNFNHRVQVFDSSGNYIMDWGSAGSGAGQLQNPQGIAVDATGRVWVADANNNRIQIFAEPESSGEPLTAALVTGPGHASTFTLNADGSFTYTPTADWNGTDTFVYEANDGNGGVTQETVSITVTPVNDAPVAVDDAVTATEDTLFTSTVDLDFNDTDLDGDALTVVAGTFATTQGGSLVLAADGSYTYTPAANFNGIDTVDYTVTDGALTDVGTLTITINPVNDAPVAVDDAITATEDTLFTSTVDLDFNDTDLDGDSLSVVAGTFATTQGGSLVLAADGSYTYTPAANFTGIDTVDYTVTDGTLTDVGTLTITVNPVNDAPVAVDDAITATEDTVFTSTVDLDFNDTDLDGDASQLSPGPLPRPRVVHWYWPPTAATPIRRRQTLTASIPLITPSPTAP